MIQGDDGALRRENKAEIEPSCRSGAPDLKVLQKNYAACNVNETAGQNHFTKCEFKTLEKFVGKKFLPCNASLVFVGSLGEEQRIT